ncbi:uncharacterized protein GIQ15_00465 [Arthroderma uncinatum]|uniref:uncharacterized protein n=1 Tax=Arthroderma uncinatum TaxID=74035 RepID=UPI00144A68FA|nr:uncharacterized protein GIQ15_00465 [Arthroderma uncinatum]KAF3490948.1 hypothetical protein GIQ15_00465 [Arthroderma uncinatum]
MLPPFRIKGIVGHPLHRRRSSKNDAEHGSESSATETPENQQSAEFEVQGDGVVQVSASEYDSTISNLPAAKLRYQDEDDGEIVVVGSSLELSQLIGEILPSSYCLPLSTLNAEQSPAMHTFEIQQTIPVVNIWRDFRLRTVRNSISGLPSGQPIPLSRSRPLEASRRLINTRPNSSYDTKDLPVAQKGDGSSEAPLSWHDGYLQTMANMDNKEHYASDTKDPNDVTTETNTDKHLESSAEGSSSGSKYITEEGKKQAHAAGRLLRDAHRAYWPKLPGALPADDRGNFWRTYEPTQQFCEYPLTTREREPDSPESPLETPSKPLLSQFEAELSRLMAENTQWESAPATTTTTTVEPKVVTSQEPTPNWASTEAQGPRTEPAQEPASYSASEEAPCPAETIPHIVTVFGKSFQSLLSHVTELNTELTARLPEVEQRVTNLQHQVPDQMQNAIHETLHAMGCHIQNLAGIMQEAAASARSSSIATSEAERVVTAQMTNLRNLASEIREVGSSLLSSFEKGSKSQEDCNDPEVNANTNAPDPASAPEAVNPAITNIFIGNLPPDATEESVITALANQGFVGKVTLPKDSLTGDHAGFCYVHFPSTYAAAAALPALRGTLIGGCIINVEPSSEPLNQEPSTTTDLSEDPIVHLTSELSCMASEPERPHISFNLPVSELDNDTSSTSRAHQRPETTSQVEPVDIPVPEQGNVQPRPNTALLDESEANLAERYPSLFASRGTDNVEPNLQHDAHAISPSTSNEYSSGMDRYPSMRQLEMQPLFMHEPQPVWDWQAPRPHVNRGSSVRDFRAPEQNINPFRQEESSGPPVPDRIPGSWPWDQDTQQGNPRGIRGENLSGPSISNTQSYPNQPIRSDLSSPFTPFPPRFPPLPTTTTSPLRRSATERVRRASPRTSEFYPYPQRRFSNHELADMSTNREHLSNLPGTFPHEIQTPGITETPLDDRIELCLSHLRALGFGDDRSQDTNRLRIFAQAADGNLEEAIEMIEEERKAYEQGPVLF